MTSAGQHLSDLARTVKRLVPEPVKRSVEPRYNHARSAVRLRAMERGLRRRYGPDLVLTVADDDEMYRFIHDFWKWRHHVERMRAQSDAMRTYLVSGDVMVRALDLALSDQDRTLDGLDSFLEFACGHGRFTRFLVERLDPSRVTVSDINQAAVAFEERTFGVAGFPSTVSAADLVHPGQFEVVFVASLFSHLAVEHWGSWLQRLFDFVAPGGLLVFSTHGLYARDVIYGKRWQAQLEQKADGFWYLHTNETGGRLEDAYYGSAFVTEDYVRRQVDTLTLGSVAGVYPTALWGSQDLYVVTKRAAASP